MSKRATRIFGTPPKPDEEARQDSPNDASPPMAGNWSRVAYQGMETKLKGKTAELDILKQGQVNGILSGEIPVSITSDAITDEIGTDRIAEAPDEDEDPTSFAALVENIKNRGLRTPIRVRPKDPDWRPNPEDPRDMSGQQFLLQSGRRRLAACIELGITPIAFLSFPDDGRSRIEDLQERYFENVSRRDLTYGEKLFSIGLLADSMDLNQSQIAEILHADQTTVSRGISLYQNYDRVSELVDLATANARQISAAVKKIKNPDASKTPQTLSDAPALPFESKKIGTKTIKLTQNTSGQRTLTIKSKDLDDQVLESILKIIENGPK